MQFTREINRLLRGLLVLFAVVAMSAAYWSIVGPDTILLREDNPRRVLAEQAIQRGAILDRDGDVLAQTTRGDDGAVIREYPHPQTHGALGYFSVRYGVGGAEAAYNAVLRGDTLPQAVSGSIADGLLHRPREGSDIRLSLDLDIQRAVADAMAGQTGAVVVLEVPTGQILAMINAPSYDPNTLDTEWNALREAPGKPFFNRVLQGTYQPGGALQTVWMAAALISGMPLNEPLPAAAQPVQVDDLTLTCAVRLPNVALSLREAYAFGCPSPFTTLADALGSDGIETTLDTFQLGSLLIPADLLPVADAIPGTPTPVPTEIPLDEDSMLREAVGQGALTVSPLDMAMVASAIVNDGNAPQPYLLLETRAPDAESWTPESVTRPTIPMMTTNTARQLQDLMRYAVANGAAQNAGRPNIDIGGHATIAYSGDGAQSWFVGFTTLGSRRGVAVAVVLENSADPGLAADIGGTALAAAQRELQSATAGAEETPPPRAVSFAD